MLNDDQTLTLFTDGVVSLKTCQKRYSDNSFDFNNSKFKNKIKEKIINRECPAYNIDIYNKMIDAVQHKRIYVIFCSSDNQIGLFSFHIFIHIQVIKIIIVCHIYVFD